MIGKLREECFGQQEEKIKMKQNKKDLLVEPANKITDILEVDIKELLVREYKAYLLSKENNG